MILAIYVPITFWQNDFVAGSPLENLASIFKFALKASQRFFFSSLVIIGNNKFQ